jgi:hypothetical protein
MSLAHNVEDAQEELRERSRSPVRGAEAPAQEETALAPVAAAPAPARAAAAAGLPPVYSSVDFSSWQLVANGRNKYGSLNWNIKSRVYNGTVFNFHAGIDADEEPLFDAWSTQVWEVKAETQEGLPDNKFRLDIEVNERQLAFIQAFEDWLLGEAEKHSMDLLNVKHPVKKELLASQHFKSLIKPATEGRGPRVKMNFMVASREKLGVMHLFRWNAEEDAWREEPETLQGWAQIQPAISGHNLRGAKVRVVCARTWSLNVVKKEIYPCIEAQVIYVKEPKPNGGGSYDGGLTRQQRLALLRSD